MHASRQTEKSLQTLQRIHQCTQPTYCCTCNNEALDVSKPLFCSSCSIHTSSVRQFCTARLCMHAAVLIRKCTGVRTGAIVVVLGLYLKIVVGCMLVPVLGEFSLYSHDPSSLNKPRGRSSCSCSTELYKEGRHSACARCHGVSPMYSSNWLISAVGQRSAARKR